MTSTLWPAPAPSTLRTAPTPVTTAHPMRAATAGGVPSGIRMTDSCASTARSAKHETPRKWCTRSPRTDSRLVPSSRPPVETWRLADVHSAGRPDEQNAQWPHRGRHMSTTWSPGATRVTPGPTASTTPAPSWPSTIGRRVRQVAGHVVQVAVAHAGGLHPDQDLPGAGLVQVDVLDAHRLPGLAQDRCLHCRLLWRRFRRRRRNKVPWVVGCSG